MLHIGADMVIRKKDLLLIVDLQKSLQESTKIFLNDLQSKGHLVRCQTPKSVVIVTRNGEVYAYESPIYAMTLFKRSEQKGLFENER